MVRGQRCVRTCSDVCEQQLFSLLTSQFFHELWSCRRFVYRFLMNPWTWFEIFFLALQLMIFVTTIEAWVSGMASS